MRLQRVFFRIDDSGFKKLQEWYRRVIYAVNIAVNRQFFPARPALNMPCQAKGMPSRAAQGDWKLGTNGYRGASWSEDFVDLEPKGSPFSGHRLPILLHRLQCGMLILKCTLVLLFIARLFLS